MIRIADYIAQRLSYLQNVFTVTGGAAMHLNDAFASSNMRCIYHHHEQAAAMAAEACARITGHPAVLCVTAGPGGINALNGVFGAYTDSVPMLVLSGQARTETFREDYSELRQLGDQEVDIVSMVKKITKYAVAVRNPYNVRFELEKALRLTTSGRPGPCWLDLPIDVQGTSIDELKMPGYYLPNIDGKYDYDLMWAGIRKVIDCLAIARRPVILAGTGIRAGHCVTVFQDFIKLLGIPVVTAWTHDTVGFNQHLYCGQQGTIGDYAGNHAVQNADFLLILGSRLNLRQVSYNWASFAPSAYKAWVDIDKAELTKPTVVPNLPIHSDLWTFLIHLKQQLSETKYCPTADHVSWLRECRKYYEEHPVVKPEYHGRDGYIHPYVFVDELFKHLPDDATVICGDATACIVTFQVAKLKPNQRLISNSGCASMGYDLPAAIGAAIASKNNNPVICMAGDGSIQFNIQELQTIRHYNLPIKIFVLNNRGYHSIEGTQKRHFGRQAGCNTKSGLSLPDFVHVGEAYGIPSYRLSSLVGMEDGFKTLFNKSGPCLVDVTIGNDYEFEPRLKSELVDGKMTTASMDSMYL